MPSFPDDRAEPPGTPVRPIAAPPVPGPVPPAAPEAGPPAADGAGEQPCDLQEFAVRLRRTNAEFQHLTHEFAQSQGLHHTDVQALVAILDGDGRGGPLTPGRLRRHLDLTSGAVSACLDRLERAGHVHRVRDGADGRVVRLHYAPGAKALAREFFRPLAEGTDRARRHFTAAEQRTVLRFLDVLNDELEGLRREPPGGDPAAPSA